MNSMEKEILLQLKNITVQYGGVQALTDASIEIDEGEIVVLMGPNGAGKSTILRSIFGLTPVKRGVFLWHEKSFIPISHEVVDRGVAFIPQGRQVFYSLTVLENLEIGAYTVKNKDEVKELKKIYG